jgi:hypothetical protein
MTTEVLGFFIIIGALIVVLLRYQRQRGADAEEMETAAEKLRYELERSADAIISRMGGHIDHLEKLIAEADERSALLDRQLAELREAAELNDSERTDADEFSTLLSASIAAGQNTLDETAGSAYSPSVPVSPVRMPAPVDTQEAPPVYAPSMAEPPAESAVTETRPAHSARAEEALRHRKVSPAMQARKLLAQGYSTTEIARNVHLGRGAIELIRQMENNQQN